MRVHRLKPNLDACLAFLEMADRSSCTEAKGFHAALEARRLTAIALAVA